MAKKEIKTQTIEEILADHVERLRSIRAEEKRAQQRILNITAAKEAYLADPNQETLANNLRKAGVILSRYVVVE